MITEIPLRRADGSEMSLGDHVGQVVLVVNVASHCGLTPQYESLERLHREQRARGLLVLGFPCNQFRNQEPGTDEEIQSFCRSSYGVEFPVLAKIDVNGLNRHPLYAAMLRDAPEMVEKPTGGMRDRLAARGTTSPAGDVMWNFEKFLIGRDGRVLGRFSPDIIVDDQPLRGAIEAALADAPRH